MRLQQAILLNSIKEKMLRSWKTRVVVARALVAEDSGPGFDSRRQPRFFIYFPLLFSTPL